MTYVWEQDMSIENREQQVDQLLRGIYRMCVNRDDCKDCPFYITKCTFGEPRPSTWFDEETIGNKFSPNYLKFTDKDIVIKAKEEASEPAQEDAQAAPQATSQAEAKAEAKRKEYEARLVRSTKQLQNFLTTAIDQENFSILTDDVDAPHGGVGVNVNKALLTLLPSDPSVAQTVIDKAVGNIVTEYGFSDSDNVVSSDSINAYFYF